MLVGSVGGGTNSTAMIVGWHERGIVPYALLFADTGGEKPETYAHVAALSDWCESVGFPRIITVRAPGKTLENDSLDRNALPAVAYGFKTCSLRWKVEPQERWLNNNDDAKAVWLAGGMVTKAIGFDYGESRRAKKFLDPKYDTTYPLIDWKWDRSECVKAIARAGLSQPGKSSCFFCPNMRPSEVSQLKENNPELYLRALAMEKNADLTRIKGLGRSWSWAELDRQREWVGFTEQPCGCYDGE